MTGMHQCEMAEMTVVPLWAAYILMALWEN